MQVKRLEVGALGENCYIIYDETKEAAIIDPGDEAGRIIDWVEEKGLNVKYIINTHAHADHIGANTDVKAKTGGILLISAADAPWLENPKYNLSAFMGDAVISCPADKLLDDGEEISFGNIKLQVLATPGHTPGGICLYGEGVLFSGDTLFNGSVGRCDFPFGSMEQLMESISTRLMPLPPATKVYPGHGPMTTIGDELAMNPYMR